MSRIYSLSALHACVLRAQPLCHRRIRRLLAMPAAPNEPAAIPRLPATCMPHDERGEAHAPPTSSHHNCADSRWRRRPPPTHTAPVWLSVTSQHTVQHVALLCCCCTLTRHHSAIAVPAPPPSSCSLAATAATYRRRDCAARQQQHAWRRHQATACNQPRLCAWSGSELLLPLHPATLHLGALLPTPHCMRAHAHCGACCSLSPACISASTASHALQRARKQASEGACRDARACARVRAHAP